MYGKYGGGYSNSAKGFATNVGTATNGGSDAAEFFDSPGNDTFYAYANYQNSGQTLAGMYGSYGGGYSNSASGFATMVGNSTSGGNDIGQPGRFGRPQRHATRTQRSLHFTEAATRRRRWGSKSSTPSTARGAKTPRAIAP